MRLRRIVVTTLLSLFAWTVPASSTLAADNPIVLENQQPGSYGWLYSMRLADDATGQIKGYASATSVKQNESITLYVTVNPAQTYTIDFYRIGWYGGMGGRLRLHVDSLGGVQQPPCDTDPTTGLIACNWAPSYTLTVPGDWTSGIYAALLTNAQGYQNYVIFVVRDGRPAPFLYQQGIATGQAYNNYPNDGRTGKSLYFFNSYGANTVSGNTSAVKVSFDRPYADSGSADFFNWEVNLVRWLERSGYDVTYSTDIDTHANGGELQNHKAFFSAGHDEYWSKEMFDAAEAARDAGVNLAFFGGNAVYTQVRFEPSAVGVANRVMVCYRNQPWNPIDPVQGPTTTTEFRSPPVNRPEQTLIGIMSAAQLPNSDYVVINSSHWVYAGTGFQDGDVVPGIGGYEAESFWPNFPPPNSANQTLLSRSPFTYPNNGLTIHLNSSIYQAPSGAWVFAAGTMSWSWALDDVPGPFSHFRVDSRIQRATANNLNDFLTGAPSTNNPLITNFTPTSGPVGASVNIGGTNFTGATAVTFNGASASFTVTSDTAIQVVVPTAATTGPLSVSTPAGTATSVREFIFVRPPTITSFTPTSAQAGAVVTINGVGFTGATAVAFNGTAAPFTVISDSAIQAGVPAGATTGPLSVTTPQGTATSPSAFTVVGSAPTLSSLSLSPTSVTGGSSSTGTVTLSGPAPSGGAVVALSSSNTSVATVPASVTVPGNATSATFTVSTSPVSTTTSVTISGSYNGTTLSASLTVTPAPPTLSSLSLSPSSVTGGSSSTGTVTLSGPAPSGGAVVSLSSNNTGAATVPASVTVPAGSTSATFTVSTTPVGSTTVVTISGSYGATRTASLTVTPPTLSSLSLSPSSVTGGSSSTGTVTLSAPAPSGGAVVSLSSNNTGAATVPASVTVPAGSTSATFTVSTSPVGSSTVVTISGSYG